MGRNFEKSYDDLVYDDNFYEDNFNKDVKLEESETKEEKSDTQELICVCEECDHQWEEVVNPSAQEKLFCPMCGSNSIVQI